MTQESFNQERTKVRIARNILWLCNVDFNQASRVCVGGQVQAEASQASQVSLDIMDNPWPRFRGHFGSRHFLFERSHGFLVSRAFLVTACNPVFVVSFRSHVSSSHAMMKKCTIPYLGLWCEPVHRNFVLLMVFRS